MLILYIFLLFLLLIVLKTFFFFIFQKRKLFCFLLLVKLIQKSNIKMFSTKFPYQKKGAKDLKKIINPNFKSNFIGIINF